MSETPGLQDFLVSGASRARTGDLLGAIQALSQLSYSPGQRRKCRAEGRSVAAPRVRAPSRSGAVTRDLGGSSNRPITSCRARQMSFRRRLTTFFIVIVVVPMAAVGFLVFRLIDESQQGKADARASGLGSAAAIIYENSSAAARSDAQTIARDVS